jgi:hypothetical protein
MNLSNDYDNSGQCESVASFTVNVTLTPVEIEVLEQLFYHGPTWDGNIVSKSSRDQLFDLKLATRVEGWSFLTAAGMRLALQNRLDRKKETRYRRERERMSRLSRIEEIINPTNTADCAVQGAPRVQSLQEALSRPENPKGLVGG